MSHISVLIVDDDFKKIATIIKTIREVSNDSFSINQSSCVQEAVENLQKKEFHLLITDLLMPLKHDDSPNKQGGEVLVKSLYRKRTNANMPIYIVGLTQFPELSKNFHGVWKVWLFDPSEEDWKVSLRDLIHHISLIKTRIAVEKIETIFVEGPTDKKVLETAMKLYFPNLIDKVSIETINYGGGASWVERQVFIWAKSLTRKKSGEYLKSIGVFDNDEPGLKAIMKLRKDLELNSAEGQTFSIIRNSYKYSPILKSIKKKGIILQTTMEDLVSIDCWNIASQNNWLKDRNSNKLTIDSNLLGFLNSDINAPLLKKNGFSDAEIILLTKEVADEFKVQFSSMVCERKGQDLICLSYLLKDCLIKLDIILDE